MDKPVITYATPADRMSAESAGPRPSLSVLDGVAIIGGIVIGAGIFTFPSTVASNVPDTFAFFGVWLAGGLISLIGALCYAELATAFPNAGGEYRYITRAFGPDVGFLLAWARMTVIQTGSIALQAFVVGAFATQIYGLGPASSAIYAGTVIVLLTGLNIAGLTLGKTAQNLLTLGVVGGLLFITALGFMADKPAAAAPAAASGATAIGFAMVMVLLTYGGWSEAAYISAEVSGGRRGMLRVLVLGIGLVTAVYLLVNIAYIAGLGLSGTAKSSALGADLVRSRLGENGARVISAIVVLAALSTTNGTILTGARTSYAVGRDFRALKWLGIWHPLVNAPVNALVLQGCIALALVLLNVTAPKGFEVMVQYTSPVFWFFMLLTSLSVIILRRWEPDRPRPFRVPLALPLIFCAVCVYMLNSSLNYSAKWAWVGVAVLAAGVPIMLLARNGHHPEDAADAA